MVHSLGIIYSSGKVDCEKIPRNFSGVNRFGPHLHQCSNTNLPTEP